MVEIQQYHYTYSFYCRPFMVIWKTKLQRYFFNVVVGANLPKEIVVAIYADEIDVDLNIYYFVPYPYSFHSISVYHGQVGIAYC